MDERIAAFLEHFVEKLSALTKAELDVVRDALIRNKQCADVSLEEEVNRNWGEICSGEYVFDRLDKEVRVGEERKGAGEGRGGDAEEGRRREER